MECYMPRRARLDAPGVLHHVIIRGIERQSIFWDNNDRENLLDRLGKLLSLTNTPCYAWAFLPNHAHFLLRSGISGLSNLMRRLLTGYAIYFNHRHDRHGQLFQNRYKSIICQEDAYLKELVRYIHLNLFRAKIVKDIFDLDEYSYCGHGALMGKRKVQWQDTEYILSHFGRYENEARRSYFSYMQAGIGQGRRPELVGGGVIRSVGGWAEVKKIKQKGQDRLKGDERILGDQDFVTDILSEANEKLNRQNILKKLGYDLEKLEQRVTDIYKIDRDEWCSRGRHKIRSEARSLFCYWAVRELGITGTCLATRLGMSQPGIIYAVTRGERIAKEKNYKLLE